MVTFVPGFMSPRCGLDQAADAEQRAESSSRATRRPWTPASSVEQGQSRAAGHHREVADHIDHIRKVAGIDHIGLGGDFDGITQVVAGSRGRLEVPGALTAELLKRGYSDDDVKKILGRTCCA